MTATLVRAMLLKWLNWQAQERACPGRPCAYAVQGAIRTSQSDAIKLQMFLLVPEGSEPIKAIWRRKNWTRPACQSRALHAIAPVVAALEQLDLLVHLV